jgi:hypothetical protein
MRELCHLELSLLLLKLFIIMVSFDNIEEVGANQSLTSLAQHQSQQGRRPGSPA